MFIEEIIKNSSEIDELELFSYIDEKVKCQNVTYFDALLEYIEENELDAEDVTKILDPSLKSLIYKECVNNNLLTDKKVPSIEEFL